jgi:hypothetical protein
MMRAAEMEAQDKRQIALDELRANRERSKDEELQQRIIKESGAIGTKAAEIGRSREVAQGEKDIKGLVNIQSQIGGSSPAASPDEIRKLIADNPQYREIYRSAGYIDKAPTTNQQRLQQTEDEAKAAVDIGAHSSLQKNLMERRAAVLNEIKAENKEADRKTERQQADRRLDILESRVAGQNIVAQQNADANTMRANRAPSSGGGSGQVEKPVTGVDLERSAKAAKSKLALNLGVAEKDVQSAVKRMRDRGTLTPEVQAQLDNYNAALSRWDNYKKPSKAGDNKTGESSASSSAVARPTTKAEFDKLKSGDAYVNPADGLTYRKK